MSFQEELEKLVVNAALNGAYEDAGQRVLSRDVISTALTSIINLVDKELPKQKKGIGTYYDDEGVEYYTCKECGGYDECDCSGFNQAISDMRAIIRGNDA